MRVLPLLLLASCAGGSRLETGGFVVEIDRKTGSLDLSHGSRPFRLDDVRLVSGDVSATTEMRYGSFRFDVSAYEADDADGIGRLHGRTSPALLDVEDAEGHRIGILGISATEDTLVLDWSPTEATLAGFSAACRGDDHFLGTGSHAFDVDHAGEAFPIWVSEPGVGKSDGEDLPADWFLQGTRHATSFAVPFLLQPERSQGILLQTHGRVDVDLCARPARRRPSSGRRTGRAPKTRAPATTSPASGSSPRRSTPTPRAWRTSSRRTASSGSPTSRRSSSRAR